MGDTETTPYDAILIVGFGGPEKREDVLPFLENVLAGKRVPRERLLEVAEHYHHFDGVSPINAQVRDLLAHLEPALRARGIDLPVYWGNRNWHPMLPDTLREMGRAGCRRVLALALAAYGSYSSCRQYRENIADAREAAGDTAPEVDKVRLFFNHPGFIAANAARVRETLERLGDDRRRDVHIDFTAHSIPRRMADGCDYEAQLRETCRLVAEDLGVPPERWALVYQSRSGRPTDPWLEPDVADHLGTLAGQGVGEVVVHPVGFLSDHMEVLYDLDVEARETAGKLGIRLHRSSTVGTHPLFVDMLVELFQERLAGGRRRTAGRLDAAPDACPPGCCRYETRRPAPATRDRADAGGRTAP